MPYFGYMTIIDSNAFLVDFERTHYFGQPVESVECLIIQMEHIRKWNMYYIGQSDGHLFSIKIAYIDSKSTRVGLRAHLIRFLNIKVISRY
jgi:hypothetical protein